MLIVSLGDGLVDAGGLNSPVHVRGGDTSNRNDENGDQDSCDGFLDLGVHVCLVCGRVVLRTLELCSNSNNPLAIVKQFS